MILSDGQAVQFAPQALGEVTPLSGTGYFYGDTGLPMLNQFAAYGELYRKQIWVATLIDKVSDAAARLQFNVWDMTPATGKTLDASSGYAKLMSEPCSLMPSMSFWRWTFATYEVYGEAFWLKVRDGNGVVVDLLPMHPSRTEIKRLTPDEQARLGYKSNLVYIFSIGVASAGLLTVPAEDVVPFLRYNPDNLMRGLSRLEALNSTLLNEDAIRRANASWWRKGARPALMISAPAALTQRAYDRLSEQAAAAHGGADNQGGTLVLEEGAKPVPVQLNAEEMQYIESRKLNREECCSRLDVPPPVVHILDRATFSNITEQMRSMYRDTMAPRLEDVESVVDYYVRPEFAGFGESKGKFALDEVLRGDFETRATAVGNLIEKGVYKPSEARPLFDLPAAGPEADKLYANSQLQELGRPAERVTITAAAQASPGEQADATEAINEAAGQQQDVAPATTQARQAPVRRGGRPPKGQA